MTGREVERRLTPWTTREILAAYALAWRAVFGSWPSRAALALLWAQASLECGRGGRPGCFSWNVGNLMHFDGREGAYHILRGAPECFPAGKVPAGWTEIPASATSIACAPGKVPAIPNSGSRFRAYDSLFDGCVDKLRVIDRQWPRAIVALASATGPEAASAFVEGLKGYFTANAAAYAATLRSLASECLRTVADADWPHEDDDPDTLRDSPTGKSSQTMKAVREQIADLSLDSPATLLRAGEGAHTVRVDDVDLEH